MKIEFSSQRREIFLFLITNMARFRHGMVSPTQNTPALQASILKTKIVSALQFCLG